MCGQAEAAIDMLKPKGGGAPRTLRGGRREPIGGALRAQKGWALRAQKGGGQIWEIVEEILRRNKKGERWTFTVKTVIITRC